MAADERPDGAWHAEWPVLRRLLLLTAGAGAVAAELLDGLQVRPDAMAAHLDQAGPLVLAERLQAELPSLLGGGPEASARVRDLLAEAASSGDPRAVLRDGIPVDAIDDQEMARLLDPRGYLGVAEQLVDRALARAARLDTTTGERHGS
jgi:3-carboxy-cis,cis-muconate cycloisomerase